MLSGPPQNLAEGQAVGIEIVRTETKQFSEPRLEFTNLPMLIQSHTPPPDLSFSRAPFSNCFLGVFISTPHFPELLIRPIPMSAVSETGIVQAFGLARRAVSHLFFLADAFVCMWFLLFFPQTTRFRFLGS